MGVFGEGRDEWEIKSADEKTKKFIENIGFEIFSADGKYFVDGNGDCYGPWSDLMTTVKRERVEGGEICYEVIRGVRDVNLEEDVYQLLHDYSECWIGKMHYWDTFEFPQGKCPSPSHYNSVIVTPVATWREDGMDGGGQKSLYSLLMLNSRVKREERFIRDLTPEEKRIRDIEASMPAW
jgi:hypothetical protein